MTSSTEESQFSLETFALEISLIRRKAEKTIECYYHTETFMHRWCCKLLKVNSSNFDRYWVRIVVAFFSVMTSAVLRTEKCLDFFFNGKTQLVLKQWCWNINLSEITSDNNFYSETLDGFVWICRIFQGTRSYCATSHLTTFSRWVQIRCNLT